jgi:hypothetical protein
VGLTVFQFQTRFRKKNLLTIKPKRWSSQKKVERNKEKLKAKREEKRKEKTLEEIYYETKKKASPAYDPYAWTKVPFKNKTYEDIHADMLEGLRWRQKGGWYV